MHFWLMDTNIAISDWFIRLSPSKYLKYMTTCLLWSSSQTLWFDVLVNVMFGSVVVLESALGFKTVTNHFLSVSVSGVAVSVAFLFCLGLGWTELGFWINVVKTQWTLQWQIIKAKVPNATILCRLWLPKWYQPHIPNFVNFFFHLKFFKQHCFLEKKCLLVKNSWLGSRL